jgi:hypothetical protein
MKEFRSLEDVDRALLPDDLLKVVRGTLKGLIDAYAEAGETFDPDEDGYTVLVERGDTDEVTRAAIGGYTLRDALFEGAVYEHGCFLTCVLFNNQFGVSIVVPDEPWLDPEVRARLASDL